MSVTSLTVDRLNDMLLFVSHGMVDSIDILTEADRMGDGDHGEGMARGFREVKTLLEATPPPATVGELFYAVGTTLLSKVGGAAGAVFGTMFMKGAAQLKTADTFDAAGLAILLQDGLQGVKDRGKAQPGDKTMVDALEPAAARAATLTEASLAEALSQVAEAAQQGAEHTKTLIAKFGKAKTLGERSKGHPDPGAISISLILGFMSEFASAEIT